MPKQHHEFRDPIHTFITVSSDERKVIDSRAVQRLRHIHQLAMTYLVYPGATHRRFEHSLGVMDLAGRVFDVLTRPENRHSDVRKYFVSDDSSDEKHKYWRSVVRMGALCHDVGHIPFSHGAETLLPAGYHHEQLSVDVILSPEMRTIFQSMTPPLRAEDVAKIAVGVKNWPGNAQDFSPWDELMTEIVTGDAFGVDRIDYLLRDSLHAGVAYGRFDHDRLIETLRILPDEQQQKPVIGIQRGGLHVAESLQLARYFMFEQLYFHKVRRALDLHLREFLRSFLPTGKYPINVNEHLNLTDNEVLVGLSKAATDQNQAGHDAALRISNRQFFRVLYERTPQDLNVNLKAVDAVFRAAEQKFGSGIVARDRHLPGTKSVEFAVERSDGTISSSLQESQVLGQIPVAKFDYVYVIPEKLVEAQKWLSINRPGIIGQTTEEEQ